MIILALVLTAWAILRKYKRSPSRQSTYRSYSNTRYISASDIDYMDGHDFEYWCADLLKYNGFTNIAVTRGSGDQGVDIIASKNGSKYAIQCKRYSKKLGNKPVQEVNTGKTIYGCQYAIVMTNSYFTLGAISAARAVGVTLWDRDSINKMIKAKSDYEYRQSREYKRQQRALAKEARRNQKALQKQNNEFSEHDIEFLEAVDDD